jgi:tRNA uridine 5-carboxymethylaminomethyl modification enzyme
MIAVDNDFDIVVVGGGHAGVEAALAATRLGAAACLLTLDRASVARMSCNPAIGGVGKGQIVREIDALGGLMGLAADATGMQFRMLNRSKGPAVWGPRCQSDRHAYAEWVQAAVARQAGLTVVEGEAVEIVTEGGAVKAVRYRPGPDEGNVRELACKAAIVSAGTFLGGVMHQGEKVWPGGRIGEAASNDLSDSLRRCGLRIDRLKTGTCPRLAAESIDYSACTRQDGDEMPGPFSFMNDSLDVRQAPCWLTATNRAVHDAVRANLHRAPLFTGQITATGPRYCPSFETKVVRFGHKDSHLIFLEPESRATNWVYANGISTSLPLDVQAEMLRNIPGLAGAEVLQWGYAIEYDFAQPTQVSATLETKCMRGLYLAGQVLGTTGYEEAAALGLVAGANAARKAAGRDEPFVLRRDQAYIGVMIDDLVTKGVAEPYRMFTSRAEHRLRLRADNADTRLTPIGREAGLVDDERWRRYSADSSVAAEAKRLMGTINVDGKSVWRRMSAPEADLGELLAADRSADAARLREITAAWSAAVRSVVIDARYDGYVAREEAAVARMRQLDAKLIPQGMDYFGVPQLRQEAKERLDALRPLSLGQALRVPGVTPADITILAVHLAAGRRA